MTSRHFLPPLFCAVGLAVLMPSAGYSAPSSTNGGISLSQTRVILSADDKAQTLTVKNTSNKPFLIQSRTLLASGHETAAPFTVTPPLFKLAPGQRQTLRIMSQDAPMPADRESLFSLSVLAIPAGEDPKDNPTQLSVGITFGLKLFYRPSGLDAPTESQGCSLRFTQSAQGLRIQNPTPWFMTLGTLRLNNTPVDLKSGPSMLSPQGELTLPSPAHLTEVQWQVINDYGALSSRCQSALTSKKEKS